jgi:hypothetical protein
MSMNKINSNIQGKIILCKYIMFRRLSNSDIFESRASHQIWKSSGMYEPLNQIWSEGHRTSPLAIYLQFVIRGLIAVSRGLSPLKIPKVTALSHIAMEMAKPNPTRKICPIRPDPNPTRPNIFRKSNWSEPDPTRPDPRRSETRDNPRLECPKSDPTRTRTTRNLTRSKPERPETRDDPRSHNPILNPIWTQMT